MSGRVVWVVATTRLRLRGVWAVLLGLGGALYPLLLPDGGLPPEVGVRTGMALAGGALSLVLAHGIVSGDVRSGALLLWIQKPGRPALHYGHRLLAMLALTLTLHLGLVVALALAGSPVAPDSPGTLVALVLADTTAVALVFLISALCLPGEGLLAFLGLALLLGVAPIAFLEPESFGRWAPVLGAVRGPTFETIALARWVDGVATRPPASTFLRPALFPAAAAGVALFLVELRARGLGVRLSGGGSGPEDG